MVRIIMTTYLRRGQLLRRIRISPARITILSVLLYTIVFGTLIAQTYRTDLMDSKVFNSLEARGAFNVISDCLKERANHEGPTKVPLDCSNDFVVAINLIANARVHVDNQSDTFGPILQTRPLVRWDALILYTGTWAVLTFASIFLVSALKASPYEADLLPDHIPSRISLSSPKSAQTETAEGFLYIDVQESKRRATEFYSRSTLMLVAGIIMAFIGVAVFYYSFGLATNQSLSKPSDGSIETSSNALYPVPALSNRKDEARSVPAPTEKSTLIDYLAHGIRPMSMLIFIEGIAWFLLKQYRALIEDYKSFQRIYQKRANYFIILKTVSAGAISQEQLLLVAAMLSEDLTGRLKTGETTENIEGVKVIEPNPVFSLIMGLIETIKKK